MTPRMRDDTIAALSTPPGRGAIHVVRLSGKRALEFAETLFRPRSLGKKLRHCVPVVGVICSADNTPVDEVIVTYFQRPRSYTGEDVVEISCHGSPVVIETVLEALVSKGASLAEPGEFSLRAFFNGKMDLSQVEGIQDLISSQTRKQARLAHRQVEGAFARRLAPHKERLVDIIVQLETAVEFVEDPVTPKSRTIIGNELKALDQQLSILGRAFELGRLLKTGWTVALTGRTNVGKSSIFNRLVSEERAIVTPIPGTTRDIIHETIDLSGAPVTVYDTAGIRKARSPIEKEGVERSTTMLAGANVCLMIADAYRGWVPADGRILARVGAGNVIVVWNKMDLVQVSGKLGSVKALRQLPQCFVSAKTGFGMDELKRAIVEMVLPMGTNEDDILVTNLRQKDCLERASAALRKAIDALDSGLSEEFAVVDLREALAIIGEITGETVVEDILERIFATFCIGK